MGHQEAVQRDGANLAAATTAARFLVELRQLRDTAGLGRAELAARAHYPRTVIEAAESGPTLPDLPVLSAYVRGCGGTAEEVAEWEDRWRSVTGAKASPLLSARDAGHSDAASAGARIGATSAAADSHDPAVIMAALDRFAERMATTPAPCSGSAWPPGAASGPAGEPVAGEPATGEPVAGEPATGEPATGEPATGEPVAGERSAPDAPAERLVPVPARRGDAKRRMPGGLWLAAGVALLVLVVLLVMLA